MSSMSLRVKTQGRSYQATIHSLGWIWYSDFEGKPWSWGKSRTPFIAICSSQVEPTLKPYDSYLPPINSHRTQDGPLNSLDEVHNWMQFHRPDVTDNRECGNLEFLCTLKILSLERMRYLLEL